METVEQMFDQLIWGTFYLLTPESFISPALFINSEASNVLTVKLCNICFHWGLICVKRIC